MDFASCPFCGEAKDFTVVGDWKGWPLAYVVCGTCHAHGPDGESREQAIANWNRRPTSTLPNACPIGNFDDMDGTWDGADDQRTVWFHRGVVDGLRTAKRVAEENGCAPAAEALQKSIEHHEKQATSTLGTGGAGGWVAGCGGSVVGVNVDAPIDDLAVARERRELAGLPSVSVEIGDGGLSMDFDLGGPGKPKR